MCAALPQVLHHRGGAATIPAPSGAEGIGRSRGHGRFPGRIVVTGPNASPSRRFLRLSTRRQVMRLERSVSDSQGTSGRRASMVAPCPGLERILSCPPWSRARSASPSARNGPDGPAPPAARGGKPTPSSRTTRVNSRLRTSLRSRHGWRGLGDDVRNRLLHDPVGRQFQVGGAPDRPSSPDGP